MFLKTQFLPDTMDIMVPNFNDVTLLPSVVRLLSVHRNLTAKYKHLPNTCQFSNPKPQILICLGHIGHGRRKGVGLLV